LFIANTSSCAPFPGAPSCGTCVLTLDKDPTRQDVGVGFKAGTNDEGRFAFQGSTATPADLPQVDASCNGPSVAPLVVSFTAPLDFGTYEAVIVIESNDPDEPLIEIPVRGQAINAPVAIAGLRAPDPVNPGAPYTDADAIEPLDRVYLDGRARGTASTTHDPRNPADTSLLTDWRWEFIETPPDTSSADFDVQDDGTGLYSFIVPSAGHYVVRLTVTNTDGVDSLDTPASRVELSAIPAVGLHLQLSWDSPTNDQDLHLTAVSEGTDRVCNEPWDCFYSNKRPRWFDSDPVGSGPNPTLDRDDTNGLGPENTNIEAPAPGVYRMYVHYYGGYNAFGQSETLATVRVWINSVQVAEYSRSLDRKDAVWAVGDVTWFANNSGTVIQYPSDVSGQVGSIDYMASCEPPSGWTFP
jgi:hypothetical protein